MGDGKVEGDFMYRTRSYLFQFGPVDPTFRFRQFRQHRAAGSQGIREWRATSIIVDDRDNGKQEIYLLSLLLHVGLWVRLSLAFPRTLPRILVRSIIAPTSGGHHLRLERSTSDSVAGDTSFSEVVGENSTELMES